MSEQLDNLASNMYDEYIRLCHETKSVPEANLEDMERIVFKARVAITDMLARDGIESKPFIAIRIDDKFVHTAQVDGDGVNVGVAEKAALLYQFQQGENEDVPQDHDESGDEESEGTEAVPN